VKFACAACGRKYATRPELIGKKISCKGCGARVRVPGEAAPVEPPRAAVSSPSIPHPGALRPDPDPLGRLGIELEEALPGGGPARDGSKPGRQGRRPGGERVATVLPSRTEAMEEVRRLEQEQAEAKAKEKRKRQKVVKDAMRKRVAGSLEMGDIVTLVGGCAGAAVVLGGLAWAYPGLRFPIGGVLCLLGLIVYLLGTAGFSKIAREEGDFHALGCRFIPLYKWYFLITRWSLVKDYVAFFVVGMAVMATGGVFIKMSDVGREAEASERALKAWQEGRAPEPPPAVPGGASRGAD
jgi:hypothetical protein